MKLKQIMLSIASAVFLCAMSACVPEFENPLVPDKNLMPDTQLTGTWMAEKDGERYWAYVYPRKDGWVDIILAELRNEKEGPQSIDIDMYEGYSASVGGARFLVVRERSTHPQEREDKLTMVHYSVSPGGILSIRMLDDSKIKAAIDKGLLNGDTKQEGYVNGSLVTSSAEELAAFISVHGINSILDEQPPAEYRKQDS